MPRLVEGRRPSRQYLSTYSTTHQATCRDRLNFNLQGYHSGLSANDIYLMQPLSTISRQRSRAIARLSSRLYRGYFVLKRSQRTLKSSVTLRRYPMPAARYPQHNGNALVTAKEPR